METLADRSLVHLEYCNNIVSCDIGIAGGSLNIKYAMNGTGKSTVAKAISLASQGKTLSSLKPYSFPPGTPDNTQPSANGVTFTNVMLFDTEYVKQYVFLPTDLVKDAFEVFIRTSDYDDSKARIETNFNDVIRLFADSENMQVLSTGLEELKTSIPANDDGSFSRRTKGVRSILEQQKCSLEAPPAELIEFRPFFEDNSLAVDWAAWKLAGIDKYAKKGICPFCAEPETDVKIQQTHLFSECFDKDSIQLTSKLLATLDKLSPFINPTKLANIKTALTKEGDRAELNTELQKLIAEAKYILHCIEALHFFSGYSISKDQIGNLVSFLEGLKFNIQNFDLLNTALLQAETKAINEKIDLTIQTVANLQKDIATLHACLMRQLTNRTKDINDFFLSAGFKYSFDIKIDDDGVAHALLLFKTTEDQTVPVDDPGSHLSWGEKNAFSLLLFMFDAIRKNADLIILDDPISSFDNCKKYAIINRLFMTGSSDNSLYMRTVLLLTHDMEPIIDYIQVGGKLDASYVNATYLQNLEGILAEYPIRKDIDILSTVILMKRTAKDSNVPLPARIGCLRKFIEHVVASPSTESNAYNILSSLIHGRNFPTYDNKGELPMSQEDYQAGLDEIIDFIPSFDYDFALTQFDGKSLLIAYQNAPYRFIQLLILRAYIQRYSEAKTRLKSNNDVLRKYIDETFHIENDYIYSFDFMTFALVPDFINTAASSFVKNELLLLEKHKAVE